MDAMVILKQEVQDENEEALVPKSVHTGSIQKVPSISDLSDPEASLGKYTILIYIHKFHRK